MINFMDIESNIPEPIKFNPLKHYLAFIKEYVYNRSLSVNGPGLKKLTLEIKHIGTRVMDVYAGNLNQDEIFTEVLDFISGNMLQEREDYMAWAGTSFSDYRSIILSDSSRWVLKYHHQHNRFIHIFPARQSPFTFRVKANTLKSAVLYIIIIGKDYINEEDLNYVRALAGLSPVKRVSEADAVTRMIEIIRG